jgi:hypothetical protein
MKRDSMLYGPFALAAGRTIRNGSGIHIATVHRVGSDSNGYALNPAEADDLARRIVDALNAVPRPMGELLTDEPVSDMRRTAQRDCPNFD